MTNAERKLRKLGWSKRNDSNSMLSYMHGFGNFMTFALFNKEKKCVTFETWIDTGNKRRREYTRLSPLDMYYLAYQVKELGWLDDENRQTD